MRHCSESSFDEIVKPYFLEENQPVCQKHFSHVYGGMRSLKFIVFECDLLSLLLMLLIIVVECQLILIMKKMDLTILFIIAF